MIKYSSISALVLLKLLSSLRKKDKMKCSASLAFYRFSLTRLINSIKHEHSCKIFYIAPLDTSFWTLKGGPYKIMYQALALCHSSWTRFIGVAPITQLRICVIKIVTFKGVTLCGKRDFPYHKYLLLKERIHSPWEQIRSFKRSSHFDKGCNWREVLLDPEVSLWCA